MIVVRKEPASRNQSISQEERVMSLIEVAAALERRLDRALAQTRGISFSEYRLLRRLQAFPEHRATRVDLASAVALTPSAVTRALKPLEKLGYVTSEKSERDARRSFAILTGPGRELVQDAQQVLSDTIRDFPGDQGGVAYVTQIQEYLAGVSK